MSYGSHKTQYNGIVNYLKNVSVEQLNAEEIESIMIEFLKSVNPILPTKKKGKIGQQQFTEKLAKSVQNKWGEFVEFIESDSSSVTHKNSKSKVMAYNPILIVSMEEEKIIKDFLIRLNLWSENSTNHYSLTMISREQKKELMNLLHK